MPYNTYRYRKEKQTNILQLAQSWFGLDIEIILDVVVEEKGVVEEIHGDVVVLREASTSQNFCSLMLP